LKLFFSPLALTGLFERIEEDESKLKASEALVRVMGAAEVKKAKDSESKEMKMKLRTCHMLKLN